MVNIRALVDQTKEEPSSAASFITPEACGKSHNQGPKAAATGIHNLWTVSIHLITIDRAHPHETIQPPLSNLS